MVKIAFEFDKEVADFLNRITRGEARSMRLFSAGGVRAFQIFEGTKTPTEDYCAYLEFPESSKQIVQVEDEKIHDC